MKKLIRIILLSTIPMLFVMASCEEELIGPKAVNTPVSNFETFWRTFDEHYGMFEVKNVQWSEIYREYRPQVNDATTDEELFDVFTHMIDPLNDNHLNLYPTNGTLPVYPGGLFRYENGKRIITKVQDDYDLDVVKKYLTDYTTLTPNLSYGLLPGGIGYLNIKGTDGLNQVKKEMDKVMKALSNAKAMVIDVRGFYGGFDPVSQYLAGCFASSKKLYMTTRKRNGPLHSDFTAPLNWWVEPNAAAFTKPVIVLTSRFTQSAGETFVLAIAQFNHVRTLGDTTAGSFSDNPTFELPNGWMFSVSVGDYRAADGKSFEGVGLVPNETIVTSRVQLLDGKDATLERAIDKLNQ